MKDVLLLAGAGQIGLAIARRVGQDLCIVIGDKSKENAQRAVETLRSAGYDAVSYEMDLSSQDSIKRLIQNALSIGEIAILVNAAGVSPSQASIKEILTVDLYGTALLLEEVGKVIKHGGSGITISSQSSYRLPALTQEEDALLATTPVNQLLHLELLQSENINDTLHAYQLAKRCNSKRVMAQAIEWAKRGARINAISPGIVITPLALDELNGPRGQFYQSMLKKSPAKRAGTVDEIANIAALVLSKDASFMTGSDILIDGGATAMYFYGNQSK